MSMMECSKCGELYGFGCHCTKGESMNTQEEQEVLKLFEPYHFQHQGNAGYTESWIFHRKEQLFSFVERIRQEQKEKDEAHVKELNANLYSDL